jgi:hypothetical protein
MESLTDEEREAAILKASRDCESAGTPALKRYYWSMMKNLIDQRSPAQIARMELSRGLRAA